MTEIAHVPAQVPKCANVTTDRAFHLGLMILKSELLQLIKNFHLMESYSIMRAIPVYSPKLIVVVTYFFH